MEGPTPNWANTERKAPKGSNKSVYGGSNTELGQHRKKSTKGVQQIGVWRVQHRTGPTPKEKHQRGPTNRCMEGPTPNWANTERKAPKGSNKSVYGGSNTELGQHRKKSTKGFQQIG